MSSSRRNYIKESRASKIERPLAYPLLVPILAAIAYHAQELHKLTTLANLGNTVNVEPQNIDYHVQKIRKGKKND